MKTKIECRSCECEIQWEHWSKWDTVVDRPWFSRFASPPPPSHTHTTTLLESNTTTLLECNTWSCQGSSLDKRAVGSLGGAWLRESKIGRKSETAGGPSLREVPILLARHLLYFFHFCILSAKHHFFSFISSFDFLFQYCRPDTVYIFFPQYCQPDTLSPRNHSSITCWLVSYARSWQTRSRFFSNPYIFIW